MPQNNLQRHVDALKKDVFLETLNAAFSRKNANSVAAQAKVLGMAYSTYKNKLEKRKNGRRGFTDSDYWLMTKKLGLSWEELAKMFGSTVLTHNTELLEVLKK